MQGFLNGLLAVQAGPTPADSSTSAADYVAVAIAGLAFALSCVLGVLNRRTANRALSLSERQEGRRESQLDVYLIATAARRRLSTGDRVLEFHVLVSNPSDRPNSVVAAELHTTYAVQGVVTTVKVRHGDTTSNDLATAGITIFELPARLEANNAISGWVRFELAGSLMQDRAVDRYDVVIRDVHGIEESLQVRVVTEAVDD